jgi:peptidoglycan/LPS O-acetylase OafA/YrhL
MRRVTYLDGLRGLAALQVVLCHCMLAIAPATLTDHFTCCGTETSLQRAILGEGRVKITSGQVSAFIFHVAVRAT